MLRIGFLGSDSTHTEAFATRLNQSQSVFSREVKVVSIWGQNLEQAKSKAGLLGIERVEEQYEDALKDIDLAMIIGRFGESHFLPAKFALERKIPTFVDKPFTTNYDEAKALAEISKKTSTPLFSASPLRFATEVRQLKEALYRTNDLLSVSTFAPASCNDLGSDPRLNSVYFYGIHALEILLEIVGYDIREFHTCVGKTMIQTQIEFNNQTCSFNLVYNADEFYAVSVARKSHHYAFNVATDGTYYSYLLKFIINDFFMKKQGIPIESTLEAIKILDKIQNVAKT